MKPLGGVAYLFRLTADSTCQLAARELAEQIVELAARRERQQWLTEQLSECSDLGQPLGDLEPPPAQHAARSLPVLDLAALGATEPAAKVFTIPRLAPSGEVTLFTGPGAVGKSLLAQQFCTAKAVGRRAIGLDLTPASAIYLTCEDDAEQLHWRQVHICKVYGLDMSGMAGALHLISVRGEPDNALAHFTPDGRIIPAPLFGRLSGLIRDTRAALVCLDNVAHLFTGNENDRGQVTQFINLLNRMAGKSGAAIMLLGHPNKGGDSYSGSTAWLNAVRSQIFMGRMEDESDPDGRTLTVGKPNYAQAGEALRFRWHNWAFILDQDLPADQRATLDETIRASSENAAFLRCLKASTEARRAVSHNPGTNYAPAVFSRMPEGKGHSRKGFEAAFERLLSIGEIALDQKLWQRENRAWKYGIAAVERCTDPLAPPPRTDPHRPIAENGGIACTDPHAPPPLYTSYITGGAEGVPPPSVEECEGGRDL